MICYSARCILSFRCIQEELKGGILKVCRLGQQAAKILTNQEKRVQFERPFVSKYCLIKIQFSLFFSHSFHVQFYHLELFLQNIALSAELFPFRIKALGHLLCLITISCLQQFCSPFLFLPFLFHQLHPFSHQLIILPILFRQFLSSFKVQSPCGEVKIPLFIFMNDDRRLTINLLLKIPFNCMPFGFLSPIPSILCVFVFDGRLKYGNIFISLYLTLVLAKPLLMPSSPLNGLRVFFLTSHLNCSLIDNMTMSLSLSQLFFPFQDHLLLSGHDLSNIGDYVGRLFCLGKGKFEVLFFQLCLFNGLEIMGLEQHWLGRLADSISKLILYLLCELVSQFGRMFYLKHFNKGFIIQDVSGLSSCVCLLWLMSSPKILPFLHCFDGQRIMNVQ